MVYRSLEEGDVTVYELRSQHEIEECDLTIGQQATGVSCGYNFQGVGVVTRAVLLFAGEESFLSLIIDPVVVQFPQEAANFTGTFTGPASGNLNIQAGLQTIPVDIDTNMQAEPGTQLVIIDFPDPPPPIPGDYDFEVSFETPISLQNVTVKAIITGKLEAGGQTFYPPLFPCTSDFASLPSIALPFEVDFTQPDISAYLSLDACDDEEYDYSGLGPPPPPPSTVADIPTLGEWGLIALAVLLGIVGFMVIRRRKVTA